MDRVRLRTGYSPVLLQEDQVGREVLLVHHPTFEVSGIVDVVVLTLFLGDALEIGLRQERCLPSPSGHPLQADAVLHVVFVEFASVLTASMASPTAPSSGLGRAGRAS